MESRKVQQSGKSSFVVSLPSDWVKAYGIEKNEPLGMQVNSDGTISIFPSQQPAQPISQEVVVCSHECTPDGLLRRLIGAYIRGCEAIDVRFNAKSYKEQHMVVSDFVSMMVGIEIVDEDEAHIRVRDIMDPGEMPMQKTMARMNLITKKMLMESVSLIGQGCTDASKSLKRMDNEVDRLWWLVARKHNILLSSPSLAGAEGITLQQSSACVLASRLVERIADHAVRISIFAGQIFPNGKPTAAALLLAQQGNECIHAYEQGMKAYSTLDPALAEQTIVLSHGLSAGFKKIMSEGVRGIPSSTVAFAYTLESLLRVAEYTAAICETVIDHAPAKEKG